MFVCAIEGHSVMTVHWVPKVSSNATKATVPILVVYLPYKGTELGYSWSILECIIMS